MKTSIKDKYHKKVSKRKYTKVQQIEENNSIKIIMTTKKVTKVDYIFDKDTAGESDGEFDQKDSC